MRNQDLSVGGEVFRMFCMRVARSAYPNDPSGYRFIPLCEGTSTTGLDDIRSTAGGKKLAALVDRRPETLAALDQVLGDQKVQGSQNFAKDELQHWLSLLLPFYGTDDPTGENALPRSTEALDAVTQKLTDPANQAVLETVARISTRQGYRTPERVLAAIRPTLSYDRLDELTKALLALVAKDGTGHDAFMGVLQAAALELAQPAETKQTPSSLDLALDLVLRAGIDDQGNDVNALFVAAEPANSLDPLLVLSRDALGNAIPVDAGDMPTPFKVAGRDDGADRDANTGIALSGGKPAYQTFDANRTALASLMRDSVSLIQRGSKDRSTVEMLLRASRPLLGKAQPNRKEDFGAGFSLTYQGTDVEHGPMANFLHAFTTLLKQPETKPMLQVLDQLVATNEAAATELIYAALQIHAESKKADYDSAQLGSGKPHEFWDDLIGFGQRMIAERPGLWQDVLNATLNPLTVAQGPILAHQMQFADEPKLAGDINSDVITGCTAQGGATTAPAYCVPVDRSMAGADVGMNRSLFQRTLSLVHGTYKAPNCNKEGATLTVQQPIPTTFPNPGFPASIIGCPDSTVAPPPATSYAKCQLIQQKSGAVTLLRAILGADKSKIIIKDDEVITCAKAAGTDVAGAQERESGITGFNLTPLERPLARFVYGPRNKFLTDMFNPLDTIDGVTVNDFEPNGIYSLEVADPDAQVDGKPQSFATALVPLLGAFDAHDTIDANGDPVGSYFFAELLDLVHMHYSSPKTELCPAAPTVTKGNEGCTQSADPTAPFYSYGTNLVSYEPLIIWSLQQQDILGVLSRSTAALKAITVTGADGAPRDGVQVLEAFIEAVLKPNPSVTYRDGTKFAKTNLCVVTTGPDGNPACTADASGKPVGRIIQGGVPPIYLLLDALDDLDAMWAQPANKDSHDLYLQVRSTLVDKLLDVVKQADGTTQFSNRRAFALTRRALPWLVARINDHTGDLESWADGLIGRLAGVLGHPLAARGMDLFDQFWQNKEAGDEVAKLLAYLFDDKANPEAFTGAVLAAADTLTFLDKDPDLTPAIRFAALLLADDAIEVVEGSSTSDAPNIEEGTAYRFLEVTRKIGDVDDDPNKLSTLAKLLRNTVLPMQNPALTNLDGKSPLEQFIDVIADVNRVDPTTPADQSLDADDDKLVFQMLHDFLSSDEVGLERLYKVIENRDIK